MICLDFDGVLHSYTSGWQGPRNIPDPPVPGALEFLVAALDEGPVAIHSSRSGHWGGRRAMKRWLHRHIGIALFSGGDGKSAGTEYPRLFARLCRQSSMEPYEHEVAATASGIVGQIQWPKYKPPALVTLDDRGVRFEGPPFPSPDELRSMKPWNRKAGPERADYVSVTLTLTRGVAEKLLREPPPAGGEWGASADALRERLEEVL